MSVRPTAIEAPVIDVPPSPINPRSITVGRAALALTWAAALVIAVGDSVPTADSELPFAAAALLTTYPLIDVFASLIGATLAGASRRALRSNAAISAVAAIALGVATFGSDAGAGLATFGVWAAASGAVQLGVAVHRQRIDGHQRPMIISGGLSTVIGLSFVAASRSEDINLAALSGYMAGGAVLYLVSARQTRTARR